jgi:hypothetical protein
VFLFAKEPRVLERASIMTRMLLKGSVAAIACPSATILKHDRCRHEHRCTENLSRHLDCGTLWRVTSKRFLSGFSKLLESQFAREEWLTVHNDCVASTWGN